MAAPRRDNAKTAANRTKAVQAISHEDKRVNNPTADAIDLVTEDVEQWKTLLYPRDPSLDPQLVWKGKDEQDAQDLEVPAPPIFRQELIEPRYLVKQLMDETKRRQNDGEDDGTEEALSLFGTDFFDDGIPDELEKIEWYKHQMNWTNRMILGDSLQVMASLAERENLRGKVQMVYIDPPYGIKFNSNWQVSARSRDVKDGNLASATREVEQLKAFRDTWDLGIHSYLAYLRDRLLAARDLLTESGSVFLQIGDENVHLARTLLDEVFGVENFVTLITVKKTSTGTGDFLASVSDYVIWYAKDRSLLKYRQIYKLKSVGGEGASAYNQLELPDGRRRRATKEEREDSSLAPTGARFFRPSPLTSDSVGREKGEGAASWFPVIFNGQEFLPSIKVRWKTNEVGMSRLKAANRLVATGRSLNYLRYLDDFPAYPINNLWEDTQSGSGMDKIYVVQTNTKVVERCMLMATDPGDLTLDPTCGSGTTAYVAEQWGRRWITIDSSRVAVTLARHRLMGAKYSAYLLADSPEGRAKEAELSQQPLDRSPSNHDIRRGFVYERVPHITLKSIANNPDIKEGMTREQIDKAINKHAEYETLYDRPYENKKAVRVAGAFTVESLSPHRSVSFDQEVPASEKAAEMMPSGASYEETILEHVKKAGVQNGYRNERLQFESVEPVSGRILTAVGIRKDAEEGTPARVGIALGPEYGTVDSLFIKNAARESLRFGKIDLLLILGFAFDANATEATNEINEERGEFSVIQERHVGKMTVLNVRMNPDLAMGDELANTGTGNLFTVFGEPDIEVTEADDGQLVAEIKGLDIYNPTTGDVRAEGPDDIMMWSIDTDYDAEAFIVRHVYFSGENGKSTGLNPYERLGKALKGQIDEEALATLFTTRSRPFPKPESGRIAVKVVNYYGDEVLKAIEV
ncbi:site-specific DNA-methyltransferase [Streptomyces naganishii]|uniref:Restriction endonuclease subunit M n=1 Tax=Streptomyces naganishii JCM 4654 TaxID=1306179 RepID=A0A919CXC9_9ACTN|nr:site-specific DNA-methyltransferase [Streptomyces naganishii]GHD90125.1 restriction endonuclease subunit M [Streptomyces naganishii JCM 4654]